MRKSVHIDFRCTEQQRDDMKAKARSAGMGLSEWLLLVAELAPLLEDENVQHNNKDRPSSVQVKG